LTPTAAQAAAASLLRLFLCDMAFITLITGKCLFSVPCLLRLCLSLRICTHSITHHLYSRLRSSHVSSFALTGGGIEPHTLFSTASARQCSTFS
jgi:hypothetical protein